MSKIVITKDLVVDKLTTDLMVRDVLGRILGKKSCEFEYKTNAKTSFLMRKGYSVAKGEMKIQRNDERMKVMVYAVVRPRWYFGLVLVLGLPLVFYPGFAFGFYLVLFIFLFWRMGRMTKILRCSMEQLEFEIDKV
ncbi:MAG: hypothetical protein M0Q46_05560 [Endomicrobiales bacterium]|nr:hypothetical protein [Endomicrobiales bacterium]